MLTLPTGTTAIGAVASKGSAAAKSGALPGFFAGMLTPILGALGGFLSMIGTIKSARSPRERTLWIITAVVFLCIFISGLAAHFLLSKDERLDTIAFFIQFIGCAAVVIAASILAKRLRRKIQIEEGPVQAKADSKSLLENPASKGFKWNMYAWLFVLAFGNPMAFLSGYAARAHDPIVASTILAVLVAAFFFCRRICLQKQDLAIQLWHAIMLIQFPLLLSILYLRWEKWTGQSPWQIKGNDLILPAVGFLLFAFAIIHWLLKRNQ